MQYALNSHALSREISVAQLGAAGRWCSAVLGAEQGRLPQQRSKPSWKRRSRSAVSWGSRKTTRRWRRKGPAKSSTSCGSLSALPTAYSRPCARTSTRSRLGSVSLRPRHRSTSSSHSPCNFCAPHTRARAHTSAPPGPPLRGTLPAGAQQAPWEAAGAASLDEKRNTADCVSACIDRAARM